LEWSGKKSLKPNVVVPYLKDNMKWGIVKVWYQLHNRLWYFLYSGAEYQANGKVVSVDELPSLEVTVVASVFTLHMIQCNVSIVDRPTNLTIPHGWWTIQAWPRFWCSHCW
jgi:hypothetical protein